MEYLVVIFWFAAVWIPCSVAAYCLLKRDARKTFLKGKPWTKGDRGICLCLSMTGPIAMLVGLWANLPSCNPNEEASW